MARIWGVNFSIVKDELVVMIRCLHRLRVMLAAVVLLHRIRKTCETPGATGIMTGGSLECLARPLSVFASGNFPERMSGNAAVDVAATPARIANHQPFRGVDRVNRKARRIALS